MKMIQEFLTAKINATTGENYKEIEHYTVPHSPCVYGKNFISSSKEDFDLYGVSRFQCPDFKNLTIQGSFLSREFSVLKLVFYRC